MEGTHLITTLPLLTRRGRKKMPTLFQFYSVETQAINLQKRDNFSLILPPSSDCRLKEGKFYSFYSIIVDYSCNMIGTYGLAYKEKISKGNQQLQEIESVDHRIVAYSETCIKRTPY